MQEQLIEIPFKQQALVRQSELIPLDALEVPITIIGAGAVGSFTALSLVKMGFENITVYDFDKIETANMNCQFYRISDIGKFKVEALKELIKDFTGVEIEAKNERYEGGTFPGIVIMAVDSMAVRRLIWDNHKEVAFNTKLIVDARMAIENVLCYAMKPLVEKDIASYEKTLYTDANAVEERCTNKAIVFTVMSIAGLISKILKDFVTDKPYSRVTFWSIENNSQQCFPSNK